MSASKAMARCVALLRGVNVGRAKRMAMADLRAMLEQLGLGEVRTMLNSGNALFAAPRPDTAALAARIEAAIVARFGFAARVIVLTAQELEGIIAGLPPTRADVDGSRLLVALASDAAALTPARPLLAQSWSPEALALGTRAAYLWCPAGVLASRLLPAFGRCTGEATTMRNWTTVQHLRDALAAGPGSGKGRSNIKEAGRHTSTDLGAVFSGLRQLMAPLAGHLVTTTDTDTELSLYTRHRMSNGKPLFFGAVKRGRNYASYHLMPVYVRPALLDGLSPTLRKRLRGKSCFNFTSVDAQALAELAALTRASLQSYREQGFA